MTTPPRVTLVSALGVSREILPQELDEYSPPLGVLTLAAELRAAYPVSVVDTDEHWRLAGRRHAFQFAVIDSILATRPDVLGFSSNSGSYPLTLRLAKHCSQALPEATILLGGPQASVTEVETLNRFPFVDFILRGEADDSLPELVAAIASDSSTAEIPGLCFRDWTGVRRNPGGPVILDMDRLPLPAYDLIPRMDELIALPLELGRGCPFSCTFCSTNDFFRRRFRLKSAAHVLEEMQAIHARWSKVKTFALVHDMFTVDRRRVMEFCDTMIAAGSPFKWGCSARTDSVDSELLSKMKDAGCHDMFFGIETGSQRMQKVIDKDLDLGVARDVLRETSRLGIHTDASLIIGYPQETREDLRDTIRFFGDAMLLPWSDPQLNVLSPLAGTPITTEFQDQLFLDENWTRISENGVLQTEEDQAMIRSFPRMFPNFYAFPYYTDRDVLRRLRDFLFYGLVRCGGLMRALKVTTGDLLGVFERWERSGFNNLSGRFTEVDYADRLITFCETEFAAVPEITATAQFYRRVYRQAARKLEPVHRSEPYLSLSDFIYIVDSACDINAMLESFRRGDHAPPAALTTPVTVVVRSKRTNRSSIRRFPDATLELLRHAEKRSPMTEIYRDFDQRSITFPGFEPHHVVAAGIEHLEQEGYARLVINS